MEGVDVGSGSSEQIFAQFTEHYYEWNFDRL